MFPAPKTTIHPKGSHALQRSPCIARGCAVPSQVAMQPPPIYESSCTTHYSFFIMRSACTRMLSTQRLDQSAPTNVGNRPPQVSGRRLQGRMKDLHGTETCKAEFINISGSPMRAPPAPEEGQLLEHFRLDACAHLFTPRSPRAGRQRGRRKC